LQGFYHSNLNPDGRLFFNGKKHSISFWNSFLLLELYVLCLMLGHYLQAWICSTRVTPWQDYLPGRDAWLQDLKFQRDLKRDYKAVAGCHRIRKGISNHQKDHDIIMH